MSAPASGPSNSTWWGVGVPFLDIRGVCARGVDVDEGRIRGWFRFGRRDLGVDGLESGVNLSSSILRLFGLFSRVMAVS